MRPVLRLGTRRSALATTQSRLVAAELGKHGIDCELVEVVTEGDINLAPLTQLGGTGVFASDLRRRLHAGEVDFAVHSLKDLPVEPEPGLVLAAIPVREDVRDVLIAGSAQVRGLDELPAGAVVGTGSPRRAAQLRAARPDVTCRPIRGNVDTRIGFVERGELDAVVLASAGLRRLGMISRASTHLPTDVMVPAAGQGALALECRAEDARTRELLVALDDEVTRACVQAERELLGVLEAGCTAPLGAYARMVAADAAHGDEAATVDGMSRQPAPQLMRLDVFVGTDDEAGLRAHGVRPWGEHVGLGADTAKQIRHLISRTKSVSDSMAPPEVV